MNKKSNLLIYIGLFFLSILIYVLILIIDNAYPFGERCFLAHDAYVQYNNMLRMFIEWLHSDDKSSIIWNRGLGISPYQDMLYYCMSPFNLIAVLLGSKHVELSLVIIIILKASLISVAGFYFFQHTNKRNADSIGLAKYNTAIDVMCSLAYGFCGYVMAYENNVIWLEGMIIIPILAIAIERLSDKGTCKMYTIWLAIAMILNFYYALYICMFAVLYFLLENRNDIKAFLKRSIIFVCASVLAALLAGVVLIPAIVVLANSAKITDNINQVGLSQFANISEYISSFFPFKDITSGSLFNNNSFCGSVVVLLTALYMLSKASTWKQKIKYGIVVAFLVLGLNWIKLNYILHGFTFTHGMGNRFAIILTFILLVMSYMLLQNLERLKALNIIMAFAVVVIVFVFSIVNNHNLNVAISYAVFLGIIVFVTMLLILYARKSIKVETLIIWIGLIWISELFANVFYVMPDKTNDIQLKEHIQLEKWETAYDNLEIEAGERKTALINENYMPNTEVNWYSSMSNGNAIASFASMGLGYYDKSEYVYSGTTPLTTLMYNVRYVLSNETGIYSGYHIVDENDVYKIYEADELAGMGFMVDKNIADWQGNKLVAENQNDFCYLGFGVDKPLFSEIDLSKAKKNYYFMDIIEVSDNYVLYRNQTNIYSPSINYSFVADEDMELYLISADNKHQTVLVTVDGVEVVSTCYYLTEFASSIGNVHKGQKVTIILYGGAEYESCGEKRVKLYSFNRELFDEVKAEIMDNTLDFVKYNGNAFYGRIDTDEAGILYLAFPYNDGFDITVDGQKTEKLRLGDGFMGVAVGEGEHDIVIKYHTPGVMIGMILSIIGIFILFINIRKTNISIQ